MKISKCEHNNGSIVFLIEEHNKDIIIYYNLWTKDAYYTDVNPGAYEIIKEYDNLEITDETDEHYNNVIFICENYKELEFYKRDEIEDIISIRNNLYKYNR